MGALHWLTAEDYPEFKRLYDEAVKEGKDSFKFNEQTILTAYAKYVVEAVENKSIKL